MVLMEEIVEFGTETKDVEFMSILQRRAIESLAYGYYPIGESRALLDRVIKNFPEHKALVGNSLKQLDRVEASRENPDDSSLLLPTIK